jgi:hypothetical protein
MNRTFINVVPSFLLRGVNPLFVAEKYQAGFFTDLKHEKDEKPIIKIAPITFIPVNSSSFEDPIYAFKDKNGYIHTMVFSNQEEYQSYLSGKEITHCCNLCDITFSHDPERIPIHIEERLIPLSDGKTKIKIVLVWGEGSYCCPDHCFTVIRMLSNQSYRFTDVTTRNSEVMYRNICKSRYPKHDLIEVDIRLLKKYGGSLTQEEFIKPETYSRSPSFVVIPVKVPYERTKK